jgi:hypothetical protein
MVPFTLTVAERQNLIAAPVLVLPAQPGRVLMPVYISIVRTTAGAGAAASGSANIRYQGNTSNLISSFPLCSLNPGRNDFDVVVGGGTLNVSFVAPATAENTALVCAGVNNQTTGAGSTFDAWMIYLSITP